MNKTAYEQGVEVALNRFKVARRHTGPARMSNSEVALAYSLLGGIPAASAAAVAATAPEGQKTTDALATGAGSLLGGAGGVLGAYHLGELLSGRSGRHRALGPGRLLGGLASYGLGQVGGAVAGHTAHKYWRGKDKPGPEVS